MIDPNSRYTPATSQELHDRASKSTSELRAHIIAMSTGVIAVFFLGLTGAEPLVQSSLEYSLAMSIVLLLSTSILAGLVASHNDAQWSYCWAKCVELQVKESEGTADEQEKTHTYWKDRVEHFHRLKKAGNAVNRWAFAAGMLVAALFLAVAL